ncbi:MAG: sigma-70 family RNA polymerase sigma factor [Polyangiaceae bacterium]|nr:sigma-70 family RNA polymerase sigma factor [Polyangiaceae bacterium]
MTEPELSFGGGVRHPHALPLQVLGQQNALVPPTQLVATTSANVLSEVMTSELLVQRARSGESQAIRQLLTQLGPGVLRTVRRTLGAQHPDVEDMMQEALVAVIKALPSFRGQCRIEHFAQRIALFRVLEERKRQRASKRAHGESAMDPDQIASRVMHPGDTLDSRRQELLRELFTTLPPAQSEAFALRHVLDYSVEMIADATATPANTVRSRLRLAKQALIARIGQSAYWRELSPEDS